MAFFKPLAESQMRAVLSRDAVTTRFPSGLKAADQTMSSCPRRTMLSFSVAASQTCTVLSTDAVTMRFPSGLKAAGPKSSYPRRAVLSFNAVTMGFPSGLRGSVLSSARMLVRRREAF
jgi:hypothetical protein